MVVFMRTSSLGVLAETDASSGVAPPSCFTWIQNTPLSLEQRWISRPCSSVMQLKAASPNWSIVVWMACMSVSNFLSISASLAWSWLRMAVSRSSDRRVTLEVVGSSLV
ncbi:hypothetical protein ASPZODRAFT_528491 [Penicilliopsis zonata CBS 506.65]|uniref:Uncharacterized protein n=1 Tax=Penicilliopsis zonata CBS 506.65 TaxID=1073090 RepID=A0A1L9SF80_9EURO|nr:hypothetical protein ASPZODRAFT_528491 [Penicilliopsis zonata CBS 506.65]OJJ45802.1 hypothetical protein ASPZODRAFT_528491 [Penicilliopsis zonata CBS 506.65]